MHALDIIERHIRYAVGDMDQDAHNELADAISLLKSELADMRKQMQVLSDAVAAMRRVEAE